MEKRICFIMEAIHQILILQLVCPFLYAFYEGRQDRRILPLYLTGWALIFCVLFTRQAAGRAENLWRYLAVSMAGSASSMLACTLLVSDRFLWQEPGGWRNWSAVRWAAWIAVTVFCLGMTVEAAMIRMNRKRRTQARENNDISWSEHTTLLQHPMGVWLVWFGIVYAAGLLCSCPRLCDLSLLNGILYLMIWLVWRLCRATEDYLEETQSLTNVPVNKIRRIRRGMMLAALILLLPIAVVSMLTGTMRTYRDLREMDLSMPIYEETMEQEFMPGAGEEYEEWMELMGSEGSAMSWPAWMEKLPAIFFALLMGAAVLGALKAARSYFLEFEGAPEENGDVAKSLEEEESVKLRPLRSRFRWGKVSEKEKIRRYYRRTIRRYRKERPQAYESPEEIEAGASFPGGFDSGELHEDYEQARYGR